MSNKTRRVRHIIIFSIIAIAIIFGKSETHAAVESSITLAAVADAHVDSINSDSNYGTETTILISDGRRKAYMRFDLSSASAITTVTNAKLNLTFNSATHSSNYECNVYALNQSNTNQTWGETTITWNNAPANASGNNVSSDATLLGSFQVPANSTDGQVFTFSSDALRKTIQANTNDTLTLIITRKTSGQYYAIYFHSRNNSTGSPTLTLSGRDDMITTAAGNGADAYVDSQNSTNNYGAETAITVTDKRRKIYMRFDISQFASIGKPAILQLTQTSTVNTDYVCNIYGLVDSSAGQMWNEQTMTWDNAPANSTLDNLTTNATLLGSFLVTASNAAGDIHSFSTNTLDTFIANDTDGVITLILTHKTSAQYWSVSFGTKENMEYDSPALIVPPQQGTLIIVN